MGERPIKTMKHHTRNPMSCFGVLLLWTWVIALADARGESLPYFTMTDLLAADCITVGQFVQKEGQIDFVIERMIKGDLVATMARMRELHSDRKWVVTTPEGRLVYKNYNSRRWEVSWDSDATKTAVWFLLSKYQNSWVERHPVELAEGFAALSEGREPALMFRLLQIIDSDMRREALEQLHAEPEAAVVAELHDLSLQTNSEVAFHAARALSQTTLLELDRFWGRWTGLGMASWVGDLLAKQDEPRMIEELRQAITTEADPLRLVSLLLCIPNAYPEKLELSLSFINHPAKEVRERVLGDIWNKMWDLNGSAFGSEVAQEKLTVLGARLTPLLEERLKVETDESCIARLKELLTREKGVPFMMRMPRDRVLPKVPAYTEEAELKFLLSLLTSSIEKGFIMESAGREIAERFFEQGFEKLKAAGANDKVYSTDMVFDGMGHVRHPRMFEYLVEHQECINRGGGTYASALRALGVQNAPGSLAAIQRLSKGCDGRQFDGLAVLKDPGTLDYLKGFEQEIKKGEHHRDEVPYLRARAMHGDPWAVKELLAAMEKPPATTYLTEYFWAPEQVVKALCGVDAPEATEVLKRAVEESWPDKDRGYFGVNYRGDLENYSGAARRNTPLGEVARRDPHWLAALALRKMRDESHPARQFAEGVFQQLTGRIGDYHADAFKRDREEPLKQLEAWWAAHKTESREQWLTSFFKEQGYAIERLDKSALPELTRALQADLFIHCLALEQISVICGKFFQRFEYRSGMANKDAMRVRVIGWLSARGHIPKE